MQLSGSRGTLKRVLGRLRVTWIRVSDLRSHYADTSQAESGHCPSPVDHDKHRSNLDRLENLSPVCGAVEKATEYSRYSSGSTALLRLLTTAHRRSTSSSTSSASMLLRLTLKIYCSTNTAQEGVAYNSWALRRSAS